MKTPSIYISTKQAACITEGIWISYNDMLLNLCPLLCISLYVYQNYFFCLYVCLSLMTKITGYKYLKQQNTY